LVNDFGALNLDATLIAAQQALTGEICLFLELVSYCLSIPAN